MHRCGGGGEFRGTGLFRRDGFALFGTVSAHVVVMRKGRRWPFWLARNFFAKKASKRGCQLTSQMRRSPSGASMRLLALIFILLGVCIVVEGRDAPSHRDGLHKPGYLAGKDTRHVGSADDEKLGPASDFVAYLPGFGVPPTPQYSGFLDAGASAPGTKLHYWFAESDDDPATKPTVLWLNGGPGSSSILGWLQEVGPLLTNRTGGLMRNPWSWTQLANVFALEAPAGVGYSYCKQQLGGGSCVNTDNSTAEASLAALLDFFTNKFPTLRNNDFFIAGESYAGVYVPTLAREIVMHNERMMGRETANAYINSSIDILIPLAGVAVGDPCTDNTFQRDSMDMLWYANKHGMVDSGDFNLLWNTCGHRAPREERKGLWLRDTNTATGWRGVDEENIKLIQQKEPKESAACRAARRRFRLSTSDGFSQTWENAWLNDLTLYGPTAVVRDDVPNTLNFYMSRWMMRADVREALHVESSPALQWPGPDDGWQYESQYAACNDLAPPATPSMVDFYRFLAPKLNKTIVFNGDTDPCVSYEGTREAIKAVGFDLLDGGDQRPYFVRLEKTDVQVLEEKPLLFGPDLSYDSPGVQFGGHVTSYAHDLSFVTVHGSGHMVPQFRPRVGFHLLKKLISGDPFAPPLPSTDELTHESEEGFDKVMDLWTLKARGGKYVDGDEA